MPLRLNSGAVSPVVQLVSVCIGEATPTNKKLDNHNSTSICAVCCEIARQTWNVTIPDELVEQLRSAKRVTVPH